MLYSQRLSGINLLPSLASQDTWWKPALDIPARTYSPPQSMFFTPLAHIINTLSPEDVSTVVAGRCWTET